MAVWAGLGAGARAAVLAGVAAAAAVTGWFVWPVSEPTAPTEVAVAQGTAATPAPVVAEAAPAVAPAPAVAAPSVAPPVKAAPAEAAAVVAVPLVPRFDVVRVAPDGAATVAGRAAPGAVVSLRVDGAEVAQVTADGQGGFAALFSLPASATPRLMSLVALSPDGAEVLGPDTVALAAVAPVAAKAVAAETIAAAGTAVAKAVPPAALLVTEAGVQVLQPGADVPPELAADMADTVSIDTISYAPDGAVQLGGRGAGAAFVRLYLDDAERATVLVAKGGQWAAVLADVAPGLYTLRADQIGTDGRVTSRFETPFKRETLEALAAAVMPAPAPIAPAAEEPQPVVPPVKEPAALAPVAVPPATAEPAAGAALAELGVAPTEAAPLEAATPSATGTESRPAEAAVAVVAKPALPAAKPLAVSITVQPGFTLWGIAQDRFGDGVLYVQVFEANKDKIRNPDLIYPGQVFTIPAAP